MIPYNIAFAVSLLIYATNCQGLTFVYEDYLAYPKYKVGLTEKKIPESNIFGNQLKNTQQVGWWNSKVEQYNNQKQVIMMSSYNQPFLCTIPIVTPEEEEEEKNKYKQKYSSELSASETQHTIENGLKLLEPLEKECLYYPTNSYWTYEYCHKKHVRQFHIDPTKTESNAQDNIEGKSVYFLGKFPERVNKKDPSTLSNRNQDTTIHITSSTNSKNNDPSLLQQQQEKENHDKYVQGSASTQLKQIGDKKLLVQRWGDGTLCDKTNQPRTTDIQFQCDIHHHGDHISNYQELSTCHYLMTISTPRLCDDSMLTSTKKPKLHQIECNPIVPDHEIIAKNKLLGDDPSNLINNSIQQQDDKENENEKEVEEPVEKDNNDDHEKEKQEIDKKNILEDQLLEAEKAFSLATSPEALMNMDVTDLMGMVEKLSKQMDELKKQQDQLQQQQQQQQASPSPSQQQQQSELPQVYYIINDNGQVEMVSGEKVLPNSVNSEISKAAQALFSQLFTGTNQAKSSINNNVHEKRKKSTIEESENQQQNRKVYEKSYYNTKHDE
ncbi:unnamed protein product [Cunninghamella echinulata]